MVFLLGKSCGVKSGINSKDTVKVINYKDTIYPKDTIITFKDRKIPYPVYLDTNCYIPKIDSLELHRFFVTRDSIEDKNLKIYSYIITQGKTLIQYKPSYKLKVPLIIKDCTIVKKDSIIYRPSKYEIHVGLISGINLISPVVDLSINRTTYSVGYDLYNKTPIVGLKYKLWSSKK